MTTEPRADAFVRAAGPGVKAGSAETAGSMTFLEFALEPWQSGPDLHLHAASDESFYVLAGELDFQIGDLRRVLRPGEFAWVPRGIAHTFANAGGTAARALTIATPGGLENYFAENAEYLASLDGPPDATVLDEIRRRHGGRRLGPPIRAAR